MKKTVSLPLGTERVIIEDVFRLIRATAEKTSLILHVHDGRGKIIGSTQGGVATRENLQKQFLEFCHRQNVVPMNIRTQSRDDYTGICSQFKIFAVTVEEFRMFAHSYGIEVVCEDFFSKANELLSSLGNDEPPKSEMEDDFWHDNPNITAKKNDQQPKTMGNTDNSRSDIPGKLPRISVGKLAIKAAWQIEIESKRAASRDEVMARLQKWADEGSEPEVLIESEKKKRGVEWRTIGGKTKTYEIEACEKCLFTWMKSRI